MLLNWMLWGSWMARVTSGRQVVLHLNYYPLSMYLTWTNIYRRAIFSSCDWLLHFPGCVCAAVFQKFSYSCLWKQLGFIVFYSKDSTYMRTKNWWMRGAASQVKLPPLSVVMSVEIEWKRFFKATKFLFTGDLRVMCTVSHTRFMCKLSNISFWKVAHPFRRAPPVRWLQMCNHHRSNSPTTPSLNLAVLKFTFFHLNIRCLARCSCSAQEVLKSS